MFAARSRNSLRCHAHLLAHPLHTAGQLMRTVHAVLIVAAMTGCGSDDNECFDDPVEKRLTIETPTDPALQLRIDSCEVDVDACPALCSLALERISLPAAAVNSCKVGFAGAKVLMDVYYTPTNDNCFFGDDVARPVGEGGGL